MLNRASTSPTFSPCRTGERVTAACSKQQWLPELIMLITSPYDRCVVRDRGSAAHLSSWIFLVLLYLAVYLGVYISGPFDLRQCRHIQLPTLHTLFYLRCIQLHLGVAVVWLAQPTQLVNGISMVFHCKRSWCIVIFGLLYFVLLTMLGQFMLYVTYLCSRILSCFYL